VIAPAIHVQNRQRKVPVDLAWLREFAAVALGECLPHCADGRFALRELPEVEVAVVSDRTIARVHRDFMQIPGATDVITFEHGEIVVSAETARSCAAEHGHSTGQELGLYIVHGLLHLNGFDDRSAADRARMHGVQDRVMEACLRRVPASISQP
jgi:probable rRNA maturation factor